MPLDIHVSSESVSDREIVAGLVGIPSSGASVESDRTPRDWSVWLLPPVAILLFAAAACLYYLPANLDLIFPARVCSCLAVASLALIAFRTLEVLRSPSNNVISYKRNGTPVVRNRLAPILGCLLGCIAFSVIPTVALFLGFSNWSFYDIDEVIRYPIQYLCISFILALALCFLWLTFTSRLRLP